MNFVLINERLTPINAHQNEFPKTGVLFVKVYYILKPEEERRKATSVPGQSNAVDPGKIKPFK